MPREAVEARLNERGWRHGWLIGFRDITNATNERTTIFSLLPRVGVGNNAPLIFPGDGHPLLTSCFLATVRSLAFDFVTRPKVGGTHLNFFIINQLPVLPPTAFSAADIAYIVPRVVELVYTAWDIKAFAADVWDEVKRQKEKGKTAEERAWAEALLNELMQRNAQYGVEEGEEGEEGKRLKAKGKSSSESSESSAPFTFNLLPLTLKPFAFNEARRAELRAELDARIARLYGLTRDELRYILDPADVYGPEFPGETFRVLKEKEIKQYGEYRTRRLVLEAWDRENT